jgi:uncharacterized metal-binding protein YceD (DUF177 family)
VAHASSRPEFSRPVNQEDIFRLPLRRSIAATAEERRGLAKRFGLVSLERLEADLEIVSAGTSGRHVLRGSFRAEVTQRCVVTLEPVEASIQEPFELFLEWDRSRDEGGGTCSGDFGADEDFVEIGKDEGLDLGEIVAQQLSLALDPYPRKADARFEEGWGAGSGEADGEARASPFSVLKKLQR